MSRVLDGSGQHPPPIAEGTRWLVAREAEAPSGENEVVASHRGKRVHRAKLEDSSAGPAQLKGPAPPTPATRKGMSGILNDHRGCTFSREVLGEFTDPGKDLCTWHVL